MLVRKTLFVICLVSSALCLAAGYGIAGQWIGAMFAVLIGVVWWLAKKYPASPLTSMGLLGTVALAVAGRLLGSPAFLMILGSALALAAWDLLLLDSAIGNQSSVQHTRNYENQHLRSLMLALGCGLLATFFGRSLNIQIPFLGWILLVAFLLFALDRVLGDIKKTGNQ